MRAFKPSISDKSQGMNKHEQSSLAISFLQQSLHRERFCNSETVLKLCQAAAVYFWLRILGSPTIIKHLAEYFRYLLSLFLTDQQQYSYFPTVTSKHHKRFPSQALLSIPHSQLSVLRSINTWTNCAVAEPEKSASLMLGSASEHDLKPIQLS